MKNQTMTPAPHYCALDTFPAELRNGRDIRTENVTEICDLSPDSGDLLCYANPDKADFIREACNAYARDQQTIKELEAANDAACEQIRKEQLATEQTDQTIKELTEALEAMLAASEKQRKAKDGDALAGAIVDGILAEEKACATLARAKEGRA